MRAHVGDTIVVPGNKVGDGERLAEIVDVRGGDGTAPFVVRWLADGHEALFFPGPEATVRPSEAAGDG